jgi:hypothetical protein
VTAVIARVSLNAEAADAHGPAERAAPSRERDNAWHRSPLRNIGLLLSGDIDKPILDADTIVVHDGLITAVGKAANCHRVPNYQSLLNRRIKPTLHLR